MHVNHSIHRPLELSSSDLFLLDRLDIAGINLTCKWYQCGKIPSPSEKSWDPTIVKSKELSSESCEKPKSQYLKEQDP